MDNMKQHAQPLQLITIELQGTQQSSLNVLLAQLDAIRASLQAGALAGQVSADDFGYRFAVSAPVESVLDAGMPVY